MEAINIAEDLSGDRDCSLAVVISLKAAYSFAKKGFFICLIFYDN